MTSVQNIFITAFLVIASMSADAAKCPDLLVWKPFFQALVTRDMLIQEIQKSNRSLVRIEIGTGGEAEVSATGKRTTQGIETYASKFYDDTQGRSYALEAAKKAFSDLELAQKFSASGLLIPFQLIKPLAVVGREVRLELIEGRTIHDLMEDPTVDSKKAKNILNRFEREIEAVQRNAIAAGYKTKLSKRDKDSGYRGLDIYVPNPADASSRITISLYPTNIVVEANSGNFVIADLQ